MMTAQEANANPYLGRTDTVPRPTHEGAFNATGREDLKRDQARWDAAREWDQDEKRRRATYLDGLQAKKDADEKQRHDADEARAADELRRKYFAADRLATEADFARDLPEIRRQARIQAVLAEPNQSRDGWLAGSRAAI